MSYSHSHNGQICAYLICPFPDAQEPDPLNEAARIEREERTKMSAESLIGKRVRYHGSEASMHGEYTITGSAPSLSGSGRTHYELDNGMLWNVRRQSFTVIESDDTPTEVLPKVV